MKVSLVSTIFNEEFSIELLLDSIALQTRKPDEIIFVDAGSSDGTRDKILKYKPRLRNLKLVIVKGVNRARGRNLGVKRSTNEIVAMTDAGCKLRKDWIEKIIKPIEDKKAQVVAGFYEMTGTTSFQKACSVFLGVLPGKFNEKFSPSARSIAFTKSAWKKVGGFPENLEGTAEDTVFSYRLNRLGLKIVPVKSAKVSWEMPNSLKTFASKVFGYARGDVESGVWWDPSKGIGTHNIKALSIFARYLLGVLLVYFLFNGQVTLFFLIILLTIYILWAFYKVWEAKRNLRVAFLGPALQITSDFAVMLGFIRGIL